MVHHRVARPVIALGLALFVSCGTPRLLRPPHRICPDGLPVEILQHPACAPEGVCGYSCLPGRWAPETGAQ